MTEACFPEAFNHAEWFFLDPDPKSPNPIDDMWIISWLVVTGPMEVYDFPLSWEWKIIPSDFPIFQRGRNQPPSS